MKVNLPKEYNFIRFIDGGFHGNIYLVMKNKQYRVLKEIVELQGGINELIFLTKIKHKYIIKLLDHFVYDNKVSLIIWCIYISIAPLYLVFKSQKFKKTILKTEKIL